MLPRRLTCVLVVGWLAACSSTPDDGTGAPATTPETGGSGGSSRGPGANTGGSLGEGGTNGTGGAPNAGGSSSVGGAPSTDGGEKPSDASAPAKDGAVPSADGSLPAKDAAVPARDGATPEAGRSLVYPPPASGTGDVPAGIAQLNLYRTALGLSTVTLDQASSIGCEGHLDYLIAEQAAKGKGYLAHDESDHDNPSYSVANEMAGEQSDLSWGSPNQSLGQGVDLWINGVYHRRPLLDPGLVKVGAASKGGYNCVNYRATGNTVAKKLDIPTIWPADGMTDVPRTFGGNEGPCPTNPANPQAGGMCAAAGFIASATFYNWGTFQKSAIDSVASVTLTDDGSQATIPLLAYYADKAAAHDPAPGFMQDEIALVPQASLGANKTYRVDISAGIKGAPTNLTWKFTTGTRAE